MKTTLGLMTAGLFLLAGCFPEQEPREYVYDYMAVIVNEGDTATRQGSIHYYDETTKQLTNPLLMHIDGAYQSAAVTSGGYAGYLWVVTNKADQITVFDATVGTLNTILQTRLKTPRFVGFYERYLLVTNRGDAVRNGGTVEYPRSYVSVYDLSSNLLHRDTLACGADAEGLLVHKDRLFVATRNGVKIFDLTQSSMPLVDSVISTKYTGKARQFVVDREDNVWVSYTDGGLMCFDPRDYTLKREYDAPVDPESGAIAITKDSTAILSYSVTGTSPKEATIYRTDLATGDRTSKVIGPYNVCSIGVSRKGNVFTADTKLSGKSTLLVFDETLTKIDERETGAGTKGFSFFVAVSYR
jgi:sugar lactone lactonase YvrE